MSTCDSMSATGYLLDVYCAPGASLPMAPGRAWPPSQMKGGRGRAFCKTGLSGPPAYSVAVRLRRDSALFGSLERSCPIRRLTVH